ncbi:MAG: response regulator [Desulfobacterales bacterium]|jgi:DNA-binding response OmpR family regulator
MMTKILVISNKEDDLIAISALLNNFVSDCQVITAPSGIQAMEKAKNESFDAIILDIEMPEMDGYEVCNLLKSDEKAEQIPIIMIAEVKSDAINRVKGLETGAYAFLKKPFHEVELTAQINMAFRISEAEKEKIILKEKLQQAQKMEEIGTLTAGIAHELNNVLFPIIGYSEISMHKLPEDSGIRDNLEKILEAADRAKSLVQQISDLQSSGRSE